MKLDAHFYPYPSQRMVVYAKNGVVATSQSLAAQAGLDILKKGGNAIDAAIATAACLTVVEPTSNGIGGDAFALVWTKGKLYGLNSSGPAPKSLTHEKIKAKGYKKIPKYGFVPVTVPGVPAGWAELSKKFGRLPFKDLIAPAIKYAEEGYPLSPVLAKYWDEGFKEYRDKTSGDEYKHWFETFAPEGRPPRVGEVWRSPDHAKTLSLIAETKAESFYRGELAEKIDAFSKKYKGFITKEDLEEFKPEWVDPIKVNYRGYDVWEIPPNGQGIIALMALNILKGFEFNSKDSIDTYHKQIEAIKLAFADGKKYITDPNKREVKIKELLSEEYARERRMLIGDNAIEPAPGTPDKSGTVYLATADSEGNMVSFIQSNYTGFGSGLVVPGTGISLQNRGKNFSLDPEHVNCVEPGKRPYHTIIPGFLTQNQEAVGPFGVMGGFMQPQGHVQVIMNTIDFKLNPQAALDAPRWLWTEGKNVKLEDHFCKAIAQGLARKGHNIELSLPYKIFGRGQIIWKNKDGVLAAGTDHRTDGTVAAW